MREIIGIDHGNGNMKTRNCVFSSGIKRSMTEPPISSRVLRYKGRYYMVGGERVELKGRKSDDDDYYLLTMAALAEEMKVRGLTKADVHLGVGLPLTRMGAEKGDFLKYLKQNEAMKFYYEGRNYQVNLNSVSIFPQGYAAVAKSLSKFHRTTVIVDIGSWTVDILPLVDHVPDLSRCKSLPLGTITAMNDINEMLRQKMDGEIEESLLKEFIIKGKGVLPARYANLIREELTEYTRRIISELRSLKFNLDLLHFVFIGGGATLMKHFLPEIPDNFSIIENIHINAIGYEDILREKLGR